MILLFIWTTSITLSIFPLVGWSKFVSEVSIAIWYNWIWLYFIFVKWTNYIILQFYIFRYQSYLMGCAFNMYSQSWNDRSYGIFLFCYCWFIPLLIIFFSYMGIIYHTRSSRKRLLTQKNIELPKDAEDGKNKNKEKLKRTDTTDSSHSPRRVSSKLHYRKITICYYWLRDEFNCIWNEIYCYE